MLLHIAAPLLHIAAPLLHIAPPLLHIAAPFKTKGKLARTSTMDSMKLWRCEGGDEERDDKGSEGERREEDSRELCTGR